MYLKSINIMRVICFVLPALLESVFSQLEEFEFSNDSLKIWCNGDRLSPSMISEEPINTSPEQVMLDDCKAPAVSIAAVLSERNISVPRSLVITFFFEQDRQLLQPRIFSGLENLLGLTINLMDSDMRMPEGILETLHSLQSLYLYRVSLPRVFNSNITELTLSTTLDQTIDCGKLRVLRLLSVIIDWSAVEPPLLHHCGSLQELELAHIEADQMNFLSKGLSIRKLRLHYDLKIVPSWIPMYFGAKLDIVDLSYNELNDIHPLAFSGLDNLTKLNFSSNQFKDIKFQDIVRTKSLSIEIDLRDNPLRLIHFEEEDYTRLAKRINGEGMNITLLVDSLIDCDCQHGWLARAVSDFPSLVVTARCRDDGTRLELVPTERLECTKNDSCYPGCSCRIRYLDNATNLWCEGITSMPHVPNMVAVVASSNNITILRSEDLPDSLKLLDISNNKMCCMNTDVAEKLFSVRERRVWLAGNPIACNCKNLDFIKAIQDHSTQVLDYKNVMCFDETYNLQPLSNMTVDLLCAGSSETYYKYTLPSVLSGVFGIMTILAISITLYHRYKRSIQEYLFIRGYCLFCVTQNEESDSDPDMLYDVFLSFCHKDEEFVVEELLPGLERDPTQPYTVCVHYRDWLAGEFIPQQIARSVDRSRRTLVVLSRNFVQSMWGLLEFRSAIMCEVRGRRPRLVAVVLDDVAKDPDLDPELRHYVRTTTYVRWGDPLFWQKLRFALPRRTAGTEAVASPSSGRGGREA